MRRHTVIAPVLACLLAALLVAAPALAADGTAPAATATDAASVRRLPLTPVQLQWPPPPPTQPGGTLPPTQPGGAPPRSGPPTSHLPSPQAGPLNDAFGRFRAALPAGTEQVNATYMFALPSAALQINISVATRDQMFQTNLQMYPEMMRQSGAQVAQQALDHRGRQASMVMAKMREPQNGTPMQSLNVFIPGPNIWLQVTGPEQSAAQIEEAMRGLLNGLQHP